MLPLLEGSNGGMTVRKKRKQKSPQDLNGQQVAYLGQVTANPTQKSLDRR